MKYKWVVEDESEKMEKKMNRLAKKGYRMVGCGEQPGRWWWVIMEKEEGPEDDDA
jgi:hypothetical protein